MTKHTYETLPLGYINDNRLCTILEIKDLKNTISKNDLMEIDVNTYKVLSILSVTKASMTIELVHHETEMKKRIKNYILENLETTNDFTKTIYMIDGIMVSGEFDCGIRGLDHNALMDDGVSWEDILNNGIVVIPENKTYISNINVSGFDSLGFEKIEKDGK